MPNCVKIYINSELINQNVEFGGHLFIAAIFVGGAKNKLPTVCPASRSTCTQKTAVEIRNRFRRKREHANTHTHDTRTHGHTHTQTIEKVSP